MFSRDPQGSAGRRPRAPLRVAAKHRTTDKLRLSHQLIRSHGQGLIANTLNFDYEVRSADEAFSALPVTNADDDMLDLALHIIKKKAGRFDPRSSMTATTRPCSNW